MKRLKMIGLICAVGVLMQYPGITTAASTTQATVNKKIATANVAVDRRKTLSTINGSQSNVVSAKPIAAEKPTAISTATLPVKGQPGARKTAITSTSIIPVTKEVSDTPKSAVSAPIKTSAASVGQAGKVIPVTKTGPAIRVFIKSVTASTVVSAEATQVVAYSGKELASISGGGSFTLVPKNGIIYINGKKTDNFIIIQPKNKNNSNILTVDGVKYRGSLLVTTLLNQNRLAVINQVSLEEYLYGVVPEEAVPSWPAAALEAQAVAARTYALHAMENKASQYYDVESDTRSQVYRGMGSEYTSTTKAVQATAGMAMLYRGKAIDALFHSDSGGYTEDSVNVWGSNVPYLRAVNDVWGAHNASTYTWTERTTRTKLEAALRAAGKDVGTLKTINLSSLQKRPMQVSDRGASGRVKTATFVGSKKTITIEGNALMQILGLRSTLFDFYVGKEPPADIDKDKIPKGHHDFGKGDPVVYIKGYGWGHGLGMSQWGAAAMAQQTNAGQPDFYKKILSHYYTGVDISRVY